MIRATARVVGAAAVAALLSGCVGSPYNWDPLYRMYWDRRNQTMYENCSGRFSNPDVVELCTEGAFRGRR